jgi:hypothetical protein
MENVMLENAVLIMVFPIGGRNGTRKRVLKFNQPVE